MREKPAQFENYSAPLAPPMTGANPDCTMNHRPTSISHSLTEPAPPQPDDHSHTEPLSGLRKKPSALEKPAPTRCPEDNSDESFPRPQSEVFTHSSSNFEPNFAFFHTHSVKGDCDEAKGLLDKGQGAGHHLSKSNPEPASSPPASSYRPSGLSSMEGKHSLSPQFSPQRLSNKPPVPFQDEEPYR